MKSSKHVAWLVPGFAEDENDTSCLTYLQALLRTFKRQYPEITITIFTFQYPFKKGWYKLFGADIYSAAGKNKKGTVRFKTWITILSEIKKVNNKNPIDLFQSFWLTECAFIGHFVSKKYNAQHAAYIMGQDCLKRNNYLVILKFLNLKIVSVSDFAADNYLKSTNKKVNAVISLGLDVGFYSFEESISRPIDILGAGSLIPLKQYDIFLEIIFEIKKDLPNIKCELCGEGVEREKLSYIIQQKNLSQNISLCGSIPRSQVLQKMNQSKIFLHTSSFESMGYVFQEALHCGCHVVAFQTGLIPQTNQTHVCNSKNEIINIIKKILNNNSSNQHQQVLSMNDTVEKLIKFYETIEM